ncbi:AraC family transcriptional regulator [Kribbella jiaozuonensis]|uniref:AraC family transcriptional regulator n=1 Tax=Kribbella jiaozuonensis TaxID=2575441 RepID=A0A4U3LWC6_9ACTN|nr:AraC family transcriptional regulator [Kribbella jiaozuonensis]TKK80441.1 AraC family transcriptional regulator [Kribbella jiaozuonensis]
MEGNRQLAELRELIVGAAGHERAIDGLLVSVVDAPTPPTAGLASPTFALVAQGRKRLALGEQVFEYGAGDYVIVSVDLPVTGHFVEASKEAPCLGVGLELRPEQIASLLLDATEKPGAAVRGLTIDHAPAELVDAMIRLLRLVHQPDDAPVLAPLVQREILWRLLRSPQGAAVREIGLADSSLSHVARVIGWIRKHYTEPFRIEDLASMAGMSTSAFHRHFRTVTELTPIQFQKKIRLHEARLRVVGLGEDVTSAGYAVGYDSPSQFSREYRREFGTPPSRDRAGSCKPAGQLI